MNLTEFQAVLDRITRSDLLRAAADWLDGSRPRHTFRQPRGWCLVLTRRRFAHRPILAMAAVRTLGRELTPEDFSGNNDKRSRWWLTERMGLTVRNLATQEV